MLMVFSQTHFRNTTILSKVRSFPRQEDLESIWEIFTLNKRNTKLLSRCTEWLSIWSQQLPKKWGSRSKEISGMLSLKWGNSKIRSLPTNKFWKDFQISEQALTWCCVSMQEEIKTRWKIALLPWLLLIFQEKTKMRKEKISMRQLTRIKLFNQNFYDI